MGPALVVLGLAVGVLGQPATYPPFPHTTHDHAYHYSDYYQHQGQGSSPPFYPGSSPEPYYPYWWPTRDSTPTTKRPKTSPAPARPARASHSRQYHIFENRTRKYYSHGNQALAYHITDYRITESITRESAVDGHRAREYRTIENVTRKYDIEGKCLREYVFVENTNLEYGAHGELIAEYQDHNNHSRDCNTHGNYSHRPQPYLNQSQDSQENHTKEGYPRDPYSPFGPPQWSGNGSRVSPPSRRYPYYRPESSGGRGRGGLGGRGRQRGIRIAIRRRSGRRRGARRGRKDRRPRQRRQAKGKDRRSSYLYHAFATIDQ